MTASEYLKSKEIIDENENLKNGEVNILEVLEDFSKIKESEFEDKYLRTLADFDNFKKRVTREKEKIVSDTKIKMIDSLLDIDNDISIAIKEILNPEQINGFEIIQKKLSSSLKKIGIEDIPTDKYDEDLHEVIGIVPSEQECVYSVVSKGYYLNGEPFRYPKIILGKNK